MTGSSNLTQLKAFVLGLNNLRILSSHFALMNGISWIT